MSANKRTT